MNHIFLALGSNLGDRLNNLQRALDMLSPKVQVLNQSPIYETEPWGYLEQPNFLNQVIEAETSLSPTTLLEFLKATEAKLGRKPTLRYGPRLIDIDLLFYNALIFNSPELTVPHPRLHQRAFVLVPLVDIAPDFVHPNYQKTVKELLSKVDTMGVNPFTGNSP